MKGEIPVFRRCCFCLPLRYGLLAWGYFKMVADAFLISLMSYSLVYTLEMIRRYADAPYVSRMYTEIIVSVIAIAVFFTDLIVTIVFIVGGHKKNVRLIRVFYFLSMGMWVATFLLASLSIGLSIQTMMTLINMRYWAIRDALLTVTFFFVVLTVQTYFLLLLRSEIIKLRDNGEFKFVNNAAEAECTMKCEEIVTGGEMVKQDVCNERN